MKRAMTLFAVIAAMSMVSTVGCKKKKADDKGGGGGMEAMSEAMDAMDMDEPMDAMEMDEPMDAMEMDAPMGDTGGDDGGDTLGIKECDEYIKIYKCYLGKLPAAAKGPAEAAYKKMVEAWKKGIDAAMGAEASKAAIAKGCKTAVESFKKAMKNNPTAKDCIK